MRYRRGWAISIIFIITDVTVLYGIFRLGAVLRNLLSPLLDGLTVTWQVEAPLAQLGILLAIGIFMIEGLYPGYGLTAVRELERMSKCVTLVFFFLAAVSYLNKPFQELSRAFLLFSWLLALVILPLEHFLIRNIISRFSWYGMPVMVFGNGSRAQQITDSLKKVKRLGWYPAGLVPINEIKYELLENTPFDVAIFAPPSNLSIENYVHILNQCFRKVILVRKTDNFGSVWVEPHDIDGQLGLEFQYNLFGEYARWIKRLVDLGLSLGLIILLSPLFVILSLLIVFDSPGPIFFYQKRLGQDFKQFNLIKFRTMTMDAEQKLSALLQKDAVTMAEYRKYHKLAVDPRLTRSGKWLRRFSLDELPQLLNVLQGDMSLVGPRAYLPSELKEMGTYAPIILRIRPGLTGWWQVMGRHKMTFKQRLELDEYYISNWSVWMDIYILMKTAWVVLGGNGA